MDNQISFFAEWSPRVLSILRIVVGFIMVAHGSQKLFGYPPFPKPPQPPPQAAQQPNQPAPPPQQPAAKPQLPTLLLVAAWLELIGGALMLLGLLTRPVAFILSGEMAVAYFKQHAASDTWPWPMTNMGEPAVLLCFVFLYLFVTGGGAWSLDSLLRRKR
jgi:putative oxidoreductase